MGMNEDGRAPRRNLLAPTNHRPAHAVWTVSKRHSTTSLGENAAHNHETLGAVRKRAICFGRGENRVISYRLFVLLCIVGMIAWLHG